MVFTPLLTFFKKNILFIFLLIIISILVYLTSLPNEFAVVDDLQGYVENTEIRSFSKSLKTLHIQNIAYSLNYHLFGINPLPLRIFSLFDHVLASFFIFLIFQYLFNKKIAYISSILFAVHPVNSESINWISAQFYILMANFQFAAILSHIAYRKTHNKRYMYLTVGIITFYLIFFQHPWVLTAPLVIGIIDIFILQKKFDSSFHKNFWLFLTPILLIYFIIRFPQTYADRMNGQSVQSGKVLMNEQALIPILESYPYSIYNMFRLYTYPKDLTIYYDGREIQSLEKLLMFGSFILYFVALIYSFNTNKKITGLLLLLPVCIAPVFSPVKVTWYITERYLYFGTGFYTAILALLFVYIEKKTSVRQSSYIIAAVIAILFSIRTIQRNSDWRSPETLAFATMKTSPKSVRPYNDVAGYYLMHNRVSDAKNYYRKALEMYPSSVAMNNLGYIYFTYDLDPSIATLDQTPENILLLVNQSMEKKEYRLALYYLNEIYEPDSRDINIINTIAAAMIELGSYKNALKYLDKAKFIDSQNADTFFYYGYLSYKKGDIKTAIKYLEQVLSLSPNHVGARANLEYLQQNKAIIPTPSQENREQK